LTLDHAQEDGRKVGYFFKKLTLEGDLRDTFAWLCHVSAAFGQIVPVSQWVNLHAGLAHVRRMLHERRRFVAGHLDRKVTDLPSSGTLVFTARYGTLSEALELTVRIGLAESPVLDIERFDNLRCG